MPRVWISIGSNLDRERSIRGAVRALRKQYGALVLSPVYESAAVGFEGAPFLNLVGGFDTDAPVSSLTATFRTIEEAFGRMRGGEKFSPRTLDIDLLTYGNLTGEIDGYQLPRNEILRYAFVLRPLADVASDDIHPLVQRSYRDLWANFEHRSQPMHCVQLDFGRCKGSVFI